MVNPGSCGSKVHPILVRCLRPDRGHYHFLSFHSYRIRLPAEDDDSGWGSVGQASLNYTGEVSNAAFTAGRDIAAASGLNGTVDRTSFIASADRRLSYDFRGLISAAYFINESSGGQYSVLPISYRTYSVTPGIRYEFGRERPWDRPSETCTSKPHITM